MASDEPQPQLPGLGDPPAGRSDVATMGTDDGSGDKEEATGAAGGPLGDFVLIAGAPCGLVLDPKPLSSMKKLNLKVSAHSPCPETIRAAAAKGEKKKQCVECGATETPKWRIHPTGQGALCNACRIRLRPAEALWEPVRVRVHLPPPATPTTVSRREKKSPSPAAAAPGEKKKQERKMKPQHSRKSPQGRPLQEYRPAASPNLELSENACKHREVVQHRQKKHKGKDHHQPPQPAAMQPRTGYELPTGEPISMDQLLQMAGASSLDEFLLNGPSAPPLIDDDDN